MLFLIFSNLDKNKIKSLSAQAFKHLKNLKTVWLNDNECINEKFNYPNAIATLKQVDRKNCSFTETFSKDSRVNVFKDLPASENLDLGKKIYSSFLYLIIFFVHILV